MKFLVKASQNPGHKIFLIADLPLMGISEPGLIIKSRLKTDQNSYEIFSRSELRWRKKNYLSFDETSEKSCSEKNRGSVKTRKKNVFVQFRLQDPVAVHRARVHAHLLSRKLHHRDRSLALSKTGELTLLETWGC